MLYSEGLKACRKTQLLLIDSFVGESQKYLLLENVNLLYKTLNVICDWMLNRNSKFDALSAKDFPYYT